MMQAKVDLKKELKNITIKPLLSTCNNFLCWIIGVPKVPEGYFQSAWNKLQEAIGGIFANDKSKKSTEVLYRVHAQLLILLNSWLATSP